MSLLKNFMKRLKGIKKSRNHKYLDEQTKKSGEELEDYTKKQIKERYCIVTNKYTRENNINFVDYLADIICTYCMPNESYFVKLFALDFWKILGGIIVKEIQFESGQKLRGFSGKGLENHIKIHLKKHFVGVTNISDAILKQCQLLLEYKYITLIYPIKNDNNNNNNNNNEFINSATYLYQFDGNKHSLFIKEVQPDRRAWTQGTIVLLNSVTFGKWVEGTIIDVNHDTLSVTYGMNNTIMQKHLNRYADYLIKSTDEFVKTRKAWKLNDYLQVYSQVQHMWYETGKIHEILPKNEFQQYDIFKVFYTNAYGNKYSKYLDRWSPLLRANRKQFTIKYSKGTEVKVYSNTQAQ